MISGRYSDGKSSKAVDCYLYVTDKGQIGITNNDLPAQDFASIKISPRLGDSTRYIDFADGSVFETEDNEAIDAIIARHDSSFITNLVHRLESSKQLVLITVVTVVLIAWLFIQFGIPHFSREVAMLLTDEQVEYLGVDLLKTMDKHMFEASELSDERQRELQALFQSLLNMLQKDNIRLEFRNSESIGANAFALPDGTVVMTDDLVRLAADDNELLSVMLHEIGHIQHRHSLRMAIQGFSLAIFITAITGDVSASSSIITSLPAILVESGYSREMETEADSYSLIYMLGHGIDPIFFANMMRKLEASHRPEFHDCLDDNKSIEDCLAQVRLDDTPKDDDNRLLGYLSSHPGFMDRIERFEKASASVSYQ